MFTDIPEVLKKYEGIPDRTILILTAEKLDLHIKEHILFKRKVYGFVIGFTAVATAFGDILLRIFGH